MYTFSNRVLAATAGLCLMSGVASAQEMHISYQGLDLARSADAAVFQTRVDAAAEALCRSHVSNMLDGAAVGACRRAVEEEAEAALPEVQRQAFARGRLAGRDIVAQR